MPWLTSPSRGNECLEATLAFIPRCWGTWSLVVIAPQNHSFSYSCAAPGGVTGSPEPCVTLAQFPHLPRMETGVAGAARLDTHRPVLPSWASVCVAPCSLAMPSDGNQNAGQSGSRCRRAQGTARKNGRAPECERLPGQMKEVWGSGEVVGRPHAIPCISPPPGNGPARGA